MGSRIPGIRSKLSFDFEQPVVLRHTLATARRTSLNLTGSRGYGKVGDGGIVGLAGPMRDDHSIAIDLGHLDTLQRLRDRANLVQLDKEVGIGDEVVVAHELHQSPEFLCEFDPSLMILLGNSIFERPDLGVRMQPLLPLGDEFNELSLR